MKKYLIGIPVIVLFVISLLFVFEAPHQAGIEASGDSCAVTGRSYSSHQAEVDAFTSQLTEEGKEYLVEDFSGM